MASEIGAEGSGVNLLTGGSGRLGTELQKLLPCIAPTRDEMDIRSPTDIPGTSTVIHCAAYTDVLKAETCRDECRSINVDGTREMAMLGKPMIYISTEYVFSGTRGNYKEDDFVDPQNYYALSKAIGEVEVRRAPRSLVIRCLFKSRPFQHEQAVIDQWTTGDYVDVIARLVAQCSLWFDAGHFKNHDTIHVGTGIKSTYELAKQTRDVVPINRDSLKVRLPMNTSLDCSRFYGMVREYEHGY